MKYFIVAGEASGDLHASNLMKGIKNNDPDADFCFFGGDLMAEQGGTLLKHYRDMAFMGFLEVLLNLRTIKANMELCKQSIIHFRPDVVILVDYPGFNLRIAKFAKLSGFKVFYYIAPKVWAWKESRVEKLKSFVDKLFVIFPFEIDYFRGKGIDPVYEGNPSIDAIANKLPNPISLSDFCEKNGLPQKPIIALVAGSRKQEIRYNLPVMLNVTKRFPEYQFVIAGAPSLDYSVYQPYISGTGVSVVFGQTYQLLSCSTLAFVTSGTATLEAALLNVPQVVCYRGNFFSMLIAWMVIKVKYISLVNLNMGFEVVRELKQYDLTPDSLYTEAIKLLPGNPERDRQLELYGQLKEKLGKMGASERVGKRIVDLIKSS
ncbi:lipid-A-disaccharide synthase [Tenuifilum sp.]|uniref:lipid-A-disaccharide synthase n=1 Tax=Tenuifilum sp. TaxID=2760880 RepID=UPI001B5E1E13|nr:lipid-A-disaccharide synthase [Bacteroidales bacterium]HOK60977.1 lipid-A-disaccharide synthase [Tenuifilum sp.]MBP9030438.1 lipid-A-disaccharide synthase [Bacteroidales bacterium]HON70228.1 lipid-A-disaccharide synthase [Tenuifilum sp.]HQE53431.1 lipid-A-disaccharide synthase [Tenuifilum sp.]